MSRKMVLGQKNSSQSTIVGFLAKTTKKNVIPRTSTPKSVETEEEADSNVDSNELSSTLCFNQEKRIAGDSITIDTIINIDNSDTSDLSKSPLKTRPSAMESYRVKNSIAKEERTEKESGCSNVLQKNSDYMKTCVISESSDSEQEDKKDIRRRLRLNQYPNRTEMEEDDEKMRVVVSQNDHYAKCSSQHSSSTSSTTLLVGNKEILNDDNDIMSKDEDERLWTLKKYNIISNKQGKDTIISDSDTDSPSPKFNGKRLPRKNWDGPDIRLNLKDLGLNKELGSWIDVIQQKPVMSTIPVTKDKLLKRREDLKELEIEILDKFFSALELIPLPILEQFPKFDPVSFKKLQGLRRHIKAKLRLVQTKLSKLQKEDENNMYEFPETAGSASSKSRETPRSCMSETRSINDHDTFDTSCTSVSKCTRAPFRQGSASVTESYINAKEHANGMEPMAAVKPPETTVSNKKSTFQLKRPIKTVLGSDVSKTIADMWDQQMSSKTMNSSVDSDCAFVKDIFNDSIKTPSSNEKNMQGNVVLDSPDSPGTCQRFTAKVETSLSIQDLEQFPALGEDCNINISDDFTEWPQSSMAQSRTYNDDEVKSKIEKDSVEYGKFTGNYKNDGVSGEFDGLTYSHSQEMLKVSEVLDLAFDENTNEKEREIAMSKLLLLAGDDAGAEEIFKKEGVSKMVHLVKVEKNEEVICRAIRIVTELCKNNISRTESVMKCVGLPWCLEIMNSTSLERVNASQCCLQNILNTYIIDIYNKPDSNFNKDLYEAQKKVDTIMLYLLNSITSRTITGPARDAVIKLITHNIRCVPMLDWAKRFVELRGVQRLMEVASERELYNKYKSSMDITSSTQTITNACSSCDNYLIIGSIRCWKRNCG
ncbi:uncharacterized protein LOC112454461 isoform X2 [Temnothorax curvispinosus]|uniref:Uncharacterized protein LOC112454461 isoform X2 n=1 Tax=Temnothorax curvispinosus TaxID=300111 RepID=A0A6J1PRL0_9HYME|nr:uncharacterized protein LOC112454461 isoform X2 [Temnothorax curvispinosus]